MVEVQSTESATCTITSYTTSVSEITVLLNTLPAQLAVLFGGGKFNFWQSVFGATTSINQSTLFHLLILNLQRFLDTPSANSMTATLNEFKRKDWGEEKNWRRGGGRGEEKDGSRNQICLLCQE